MISIGVEFMISISNISSIKTLYESLIIFKLSNDSDLIVEIWNSALSSVSLSRFVSLILLGDF